MKRYILFSVFTISFAMIMASCKAQKPGATETKAASEEVKNIKLGNEWLLVGFFNEEGVLVPDASKAAEISISPDEKLFTGNTGCNSMRGEVKTEPGGKIKLGPVDRMRKRCANAETEKKLLEALNCVTDYKIEGAVLKLYCNEKPVVQLEIYKH